ncbi:MAG TPA: hypothetical protein VMX12_11100 [Acidimicrobiia bacterium]|nr:hypothetical protein [Acidimicrobiia bacterium]
MATSRRGDIFDNVKAALDGMSTEAGYGVPWKGGQMSLPDDPPGLTPWWIVEEGEEAADMRLYPVIDWTSRVTIYGIARQTPVAGYDPREMADAMRDDIVRALMADTTRGGAAIDTMITAFRREQAVSPDVLVVVDMEIKYRTRATEPSRGI